MVDYFTKVLEDDLKAIVKPQYVDQIPKAVKARGADRNVETLVKGRSEMDNMDHIMKVLGECFQSVRLADYAGALTLTLPRAGAGQRSRN